MSLIKLFGAGLLALLLGAWALWGFIMGAALLSEPKYETYNWLHLVGNGFWFWFAVSPWIIAGAGFFFAMCVAIGSKILED